MTAKKLLADVLGWTETEIKTAIIHKDNYQFIPNRKKDGSIRRIYAPHPDLKKFQRRFLKYFLYQIIFDGECRRIIKGFRQRLSYIDNARGHITNNTNFVLRLDLKDAFPSVKTEHLRPVLREVLRTEIQRYTKKEHRLRPLFPVKKAKWFRRLIKDLPQTNLFVDPFEILDEFVELVLSLVTYQGELPQGAPTSPYLLNVVFSYSGLVKKIYQFLSDKQILVSEYGTSQVVFTIYADDFTISSSKPIPRSLINELIDLIERESFFKINRKKVFYFDRNRIAPLITGLRLVKLIKKREELEAVLLKQDLNKRERKNVLQKTLDQQGEWIIEAVRLPKKEIRRIRGLIHQARFKKTLRPKIRGHIACLKPIYGDELPNQITVPYQKYLNVL